MLEGDFIPVTMKPKNILAYLRKNESETIMVVLNFSRRKQKWQLEADLANSSWEILVSTCNRTSITIDKDAFGLNRYEALILRKTN